MQDQAPATRNNGPERRPAGDRDLLAICAKYGNAPGALIEILHDIQDARGHVAERALPIIAEALNLSRAEVYGVFTFYHDFRREQGGRHVLKLCAAEACQSMGSDQLAAGITKALGVKIGETTKNGAVTIEAVYCLGNCALAPAAMLDGRLIGRADQHKLAGVISAGKVETT